jgi:peptide/nickel transport system permease protein
VQRRTLTLCESADTAFGDGALRLALTSSTDNVHPRWVKGWWPLAQYLIRRLLQAVPILVGISVLLFALLHAVPGGPLAIYLNNPQVSPKDIARLSAQLGLDRPLPVQYVLWLKAFVTGDWGYSISTGRPVVTMIGERLPATLQLMASSLLLAAMVSLLLGIFQALRPYSALDYGATTAAFFGISIPAFWFGLILQLVFAVQLRWLPSSGRQEIGDGSFIDLLRHLVLPMIVLSLAYLAGWSRYVRSSLMETLGEDYIRTARAKGLPSWRVVTRHALRNSLIPVVTVVALDLPSLFAGAVVTETVFSWPGIGQLFITSINGLDYPTVMAILMISSFLVILCNLLADLAYGWLDPRVHYE